MFVELITCGRGTQYGTEVTRRIAPLSKTVIRRYIKHTDGAESWSNKEHQVTSGDFAGERLGERPSEAPRSPLRLGEEKSGLTGVASFSTRSGEIVRMQRHVVSRLRAERTSKG